jgi:hypothetical protein
MIRLTPAFSEFLTATCESRTPSAAMPHQLALTPALTGDRRRPQRLVLVTPHQRRPVDVRHLRVRRQALQHIGKPAGRAFTWGDDEATGFDFQIDDGAFVQTQLDSEWLQDAQCEDGSPETQNRQALSPLMTWS